MTPPAPHRVRRIFTTRAGGVSRAPYDTLNLGGAVGDEPDAVSTNRSRVANGVGLQPGRLVFMDQVHGTRVIPVEGPGPLPGTDGIVTARPDLALVVLAADCVPVLAADSTAGVVGAAHAGRPGAAAGIGPELVAAMAALGAEVARIEILLGPAICGRCYEVPPDMQEQVEAVLPGSACRTRAGTTGLDLRAGLGRQFRVAGVAGVVADPRCTFEDENLYSYRRSGRTGRHAGLIWASGG